MSKHTPGPWLCHPYVLDGETFIFNNSGTEHIADVVSEANAQLIAAAPDLLEALQLYVDLCKQDEDAYQILQDSEGGTDYRPVIGDWKKLYSQAQSAINKATKTNLL